VRIADARPTDAPALRDIHVRTWATAFRDHVPGPFYADRLAAHRVRDWPELIRHQTAAGGGVLVGWQGEAIVGLCQYGPTGDGDDDPRLVGHIDRLYVDPLFQRAGFGRALLTGATKRMRQAGMSSVTLWVLEKDVAAREFYERLGWAPDGGRRFDGAADVRYRRPVSSSAGTPTRPSSVS
jgi:ribosomal protein S18 acetylase RimI-like enzyme